jgi:hypothetical protein
MNELGVCALARSTADSGGRLDSRINSNGMADQFVPSAHAVCPESPPVKHQQTVEKPWQVSIMKFDSDELKKLSECYTVTSHGRLQYVSITVERSDMDCRCQKVIANLLSHQALSCLKGLELQLAGLMNNKWMIMADGIPSANITELGLVVPEDSVRIVELHFGKSNIRALLRCRSGKTLLENLKGSCYWKAQPVVSARDDSVDTAGELGKRERCVKGGISQVHQTCSGRATTNVGRLVIDLL